MIRELDVTPTSIGIGSIGPIDKKEGTIINSPNIPHKRVSIVELLVAEFNAPTRIMNDCATGVIGEWKHGGGKGHNNLVYITLSTGLGGGAIVDGNLLLGKDGNAVEVGHITIDPESPLICGCGCRGHWEAYCGGSNIEQLATYVLEGDIEDYQRRLGGVTAEKVFTLAREGDGDSSRIVKEYGRINAVGFANVVNMFDPEVITVGGSIALNNSELVLKPILENIDKHLINRRPEISLTLLGEDVIIYGAFVLAEMGTRAQVEKRYW
jgi:glucokinase